MQELDLNMSSLEAMSDNQLKELCVYCKVAKPFSLSKITAASKFLLLQESVRDAADLYLSLKYPPHLFVLDTPCGFSRHVNLREPDLAAMFWGDTLGCCEKPLLEMQPNLGINVPALVTSEYHAADKEMIDPGDTIAHPLTGMTQRYVLGGRFHAANNPHKSPLCRYQPSRQATRSRKTTGKMYDDSEVHACKIFLLIIFTIT
ncbi:Hypothetical predicted protein [Paramuricea clavata]|uniref:Uncharacterized protein n=1 Tax=Paramuricea clavata TaxID=317549 RepID=A0A7D9F0G4_PARCT|nr:Hypothetical predicted protein [Paramuricea clavata]